MATDQQRLEQATYLGSLDANRELAHLKEEYETLARFGEWLGVDMSCCYDAADAVRLWKQAVAEIEAGDRKFAGEKV